MSFQVNSADLKHGTEIKESVAAAEEEFKNSTAEESERKLAPENGEKLKNSRSGQLKRKLSPKSMEEFKNARDEKLRKFGFEDKEEFQEPRAGMPERRFESLNTCKRTFELWLRDRMKPDWKIKVSVANSEEEFKNTTVEELKRKVLSEDEYEKTILVYRCKTLKKNHTLGFNGIKHQDEIIKVPRGTTFTVTCPTNSSAGDTTEETYSFEDDDDDEEGKDISRTQSMDNLAIMQKTNPRPIL